MARKIYDIHIELPEVFLGQYEALNEKKAIEEAQKDLQEKITQFLPCIDIWVQQSWEILDEDDEE